MKHPRFLGFLWKHHDLKRIEGKPCTFKCLHCDKIKHRPRPSEVENLGEEIIGRPLAMVIDSYQYRRCKICGMVERRFVREGPETGPGYGRWEKCDG